MIERFWSQPDRQGFWLIIALVICLSAIVELAGLTAPFREIGERIVQPVLHISGQVIGTVELPYQVVVSSYHAYQRIQDLELRYSELAAQVGELQSLRAENAELLKMVGASPTARISTGLILPIIGYGQPLIEKNSTDQVKTGTMVLVSQTLIGVVGTVGDTQAQVQLLGQVATPPILAQTDTNVTGMVIGDGQHLWLKELPIDATVTVGQRVLTLGQSGIQPNVFIGRIVRLDRVAGEPTQAAILDPGVSFYQAHVVQVK